MEYDKNHFQKLNDKKVLHKVKKHWVVLSLSLLVMLGVGSVKIAGVHANTLNSRGQSTQSSSDNILGHQLQKTQTLQGSQNQIHSRQLNLADVSQQAEVLHRRILINAATLNQPESVNQNNFVDRDKFNVNRVDQPQQSNESQAHDQSVDVSNGRLQTQNLHNQRSLSKQNGSHFENQSNLATTEQTQGNPVGSSNSNGYIDSRGYYHAPDIDFHRTAQYDYNSSTRTLTIHDGTLIPTGNGAGTSGQYWNPYIQVDYQWKNQVVSDIDLERTVAPVDGHSLFDYNPSLRSITGYMDTSKTNSINYLFLSDTSLSDISALSHWDTSNISSMQKAFGTNFNYSAGCSSLKNLDALKNWDVSNVWNMDNMFSKCISLTNINGIRNWYTPNLRQTSYMFFEDNKLKDVDLSNWVIDNLGPMNAMFGSDNDLLYINLGPNTHFDYDSAPVSMDNGYMDKDNINVTLQKDSAGHGWESVAGPNKGQIIYNGRLIPDNSWINLKNKTPSAPLNFTWYDPVDNKNVKGNNDSINGFVGMSINANDYVPVGYKLDPTQHYNSNQTNFTLSGNTQNVTLNIVPNNIDSHGYWSGNNQNNNGNTSKWMIDSQGNLTIDGGYMTESWITPPGLNRNAVKTINFVNDPKLIAGAGDFENMPNLVSVGGGLDASNGEMNYFFFNDHNLRDISGINNWKTSSNTYSGGHMFTSDSSLTSAILPNADINARKVGSFKDWDDGEFQNCTSLKYLDLSKWNNSDATSINSFIANDPKIVYIKLGPSFSYNLESADVGGSGTAGTFTDTANVDAPKGWKSIAGANVGTVVHNGHLMPNNTWLNVANATQAQPLNLTWRDPITNQNIGTKNVVGPMGMSVNASNYLPNGYKIDPIQNCSQNQTNLVLSNQTQNVTLNVIPNNVKDYGHWGSAHWTLDYSNDLNISDGMLTHHGNHLVNDEAAAIPQSVQEETQHIYVNNVSFQEVSDNTKEADLNGLFNNAASDATHASWSGGTPIQLHYKNLESCDFLNISGVPIAVFKMMFIGDRKLKTVNGLNHLNISWNNSYQGGSPDFSGMFWDCSSLSDVTFNGGQTVQPWWLGHMFQSDTNLKSIDLSEFDTSDTATKHYGTAANYTFGSLIQSDPNIVYVKLGQKARILNGGSTNMGQPASVTNQIDAPDGWQSIQGNNEGTLVKDGNLLPGNTWLNVKNASEAAPLNISFRDQNNNSIGTPQVFKGYVGQNVNINNIIPAGYQVMPGQKTNYTLTNQTQNAVVKVNVKTVAQGYWGQCHWTIDSFGDLSIDGNGNSNNMQTPSHPSAMNGTDADVQFAPEVQKNGSLWTDVTTLNFHDAVAPTTSYGQCPSLFGGLTNLTTVNHGLDVSHMGSMWNQFVSDPKLSNINGLSDWDVSHTTQMVYMFEGTPSLHDVSPLRHWNFANNDGIGGMFKNSGIDSFDLPHLHFTYNVPNSDGHGQTGHIDNVFSSDLNLKSLDLSGLSLENYYTIANFINNDHNLLFVKLGTFNLKPVGTDPDADGKGSNLGSSVQDVIQADAQKNGTNYGWKSIAGNNSGDVVKNGQLLSHNTWINLANAVQAQPLSLNFQDQYGNKIGNPQRIDGYVGQKVNVSNLAPVGYQIAPNQQLDYTLSKQPQSVTIKVNVSTVAQGLWGQCHWIIDGLGDLDITGTGNQNNMQYNAHPSAMDGTDANVKFAPGVQKRGSLWKDITTLNFKNAVAPTNMGNMFERMSDLTIINRGLDTSNTTWVHETFQSDKRLTDINGLADWNLKSMTNLSWLFQSDLSLVDVSPISHWSDHNSGLIMGRLFDNCPSLVNVDIPHFNITAGNNWDDYEFAGDTSLRNLDLSGWDNHLTTDTDSFIAGDKNLVFIKLNPHFVPDARDIQTGEPFSKDATLDATKNGHNYGWKSIAGNNLGTVVTNGQLLGGNTWINLANAVQAQPLSLNFQDQYGNKIGNPQKIDGYVGQKINVSNLAPTGYQIAPGQQLDYTLSNQPQSVTIKVNVSTVAQGLWGQCHWIIDGLGDLDITGTGNQNNMQTSNHPSAMDETDSNTKFAPNVQKRGSLWKDINTINFKNAVAPTNMGDMFANMFDLTTINSGLDTGSTTYAGNTFSDDPELNDINGLSNWDVSHVNGFGHIFAGDTSLTNFNMPNWHVGQNTTACNLDNLFSGDTALKSVDFSGFNTNHSVLDNLFGGAKSYSPNKFNDYKPITGLVYMKLGPNFKIAQSNYDNGGSGTPIRQDLIEIAPKGWESITGNNVGDVVTDGNVLPNNTWLNIANAPAAQPLNFTWHDTENGQNVKGSNDTVTGNLGKKVNATDDLPKGYRLDPNSHYNSGQTNFLLSKKIQNVTLNVIPMTKVDDIQFDLSGNNIPANNAGPTGIITSDKTDYKGNDNRAANAGNTTYTFTNNATNLKGMPAHYHVAGNQIINYDGGTHKIEIVPDTVTDAVNYIYKNHGTLIHSGFRPRGVYETKNTINWGDYGYNQMPVNWNISNDGTQNFVFNGGSHNVDIVPNQVSDTVTYVDVNNNQPVVGHHAFRGNVYNASDSQAESDTHFTVNNSNATGLPSGYLVERGNGYGNQNLTFNFDGNPHTIYVSPVYRGLTYRYDAGTKTVEFNGGTPNPDLSSFVSNAPSNDVRNDIRNAAVIKFDSDINFGSVNNMNGLISWDQNVRRIILPRDFDTSNVANMDRMFNSDHNLQEIDNLSDAKFNTSKVSNDMSYMFWGDNSLTSLSFGSGFTTNGKNISGIFDGDNALQNIKIQSPNTRFNNMNINNEHWLPADGSVVEPVNLADGKPHNGKKGMIWTRSAELLTYVDPNGQQISRAVLQKPYNSSVAINKSLPGFPDHYEPDSSNPAAFTVNGGETDVHVTNDQQINLRDQEPVRIVYEESNGQSSTSDRRVTVHGHPNQTMPFYSYQVMPDAAHSGYILDRNLTALSVPMKFNGMNNFSWPQGEPTVYFKDVEAAVRTVFINQNGQMVGQPVFYSGVAGQSVHMISDSDQGRHCRIASASPDSSLTTSDYYVVPGQDQYQNFTLQPGTHTVYIHLQGRPAHNDQVMIRCLLQQSDGNYLPSDRPFTLPNRLYGDSDQVNPSDVKIKGYSPAPSDEPQNVNVTSDGVQPQRLVFRYEKTPHGYGTLLVHYVNSDGWILGSAKITKSVGSSVTLPNSSDAPLPEGYSPDGSQQQTYTITDTPQEVYLTVTGEPAVNATLTLYQLTRDADGSHQSMQKHRISLSNLKVGDSFHISPYGYYDQQRNWHSLTPSDYHVDSSDQDQDVTVTPNQQLSQTSIYYGYTKDFQSDQVKAVRIHYVLSDGTPVDTVSDHGAKNASFDIQPYLDDLPADVSNNYEQVDSQVYSKYNNAKSKVGISSESLKYGSYPDLYIVLRKS